MTINPNGAAGATGTTPFANTTSDDGDRLGHGATNTTNGAAGRRGADIDTADDGARDCSDSAGRGDRVGHGATNTTNEAAGRRGADIDTS